MASWQPWRCYLARKKKKRSRWATRFIYRHDVDFYLILFFLCSTFDAILKSWITSGVHVRCDFFLLLFLDLLLLFVSFLFLFMHLAHLSRFLVAPVFTASSIVFSFLLSVDIPFFPLSLSLFLLSDCTTTIHVNNVHLTSIPSLPVEQSHTYCDVGFSCSARDVPVANSILHSSETQ